jgi:hypothetical protein
MRTPTTLLAALAMTALLSAGFPAGPAPAGAAGGDLSREAERWLERVESNDRGLAAGEWRRALRSVRRLVFQLPAGFTPLTQRPALGALALQQSLALVGTGEPEEARWYAEMAWGLDPRLGQRPLGEIYGAPGAQVIVWMREAESFWEPIGGVPPCREPEGGSEISPPERPIRGVEVRTSRARYLYPPRGAVSHALVVDESGEPRAPRLVDARGANPSAMWSALVSGRSDRYQPALRDGVPVACRLDGLTLLAMG